jgi:hypothetical protein
MVFEGYLSYIFFPIYLIVFAALFFYVRGILIREGFNVMCMFVLTYGLFYLLVPFLQTYFKLYRNNISWFSVLLNRLSIEEIFFNFLLAVTILIFIILSYTIKSRNSENNKLQHKNITVELKLKINHIPKVVKLTDLVFIVSALSIILLIRETGSLSNYFSLGVFTRGIDKDTSDYIRSSYLQLVTGSVLVLATPYLYLFIYRLKKNKLVFIKFIMSMIFSIIFLLHNQGRAPLVLFFLPFLFTIRDTRQKNVFGLMLVLISVVLSLDYIDGFFKYLAYGYFPTNSTTNYINTFLGEFSYPFANFSSRHNLIKYVDYRLGIDYLIWPITIIPSFLLNIIGINKENIISILTMNTSAYGTILGDMPSGGIPVDFLTVHFYQFGYATLLIASVIMGRILKYFDIIFLHFKNEFAIKIILYRLSFSIINILNNNDFSAIIRNRLDVVLIAIILIYIYKQRTTQNKNSFETR